MCCFPRCISLCPSFYSHSWGREAVKKEMDLDSNCLFLKRGWANGLQVCHWRVLRRVCWNKGVKAPPSSLIVVCTPHSTAQPKGKRAAKADPTLLSLAHQNVLPLAEGMRSTTPRSITCYTNVIWLSWLHSKIIIILLDVIQTWTWIFHHCNYTGNVFVI